MVFEIVVHFLPHDHVAQRCQIMNTCKYESDTWNSCTVHEIPGFACRAATDRCSEELTLMQIQAHQHSSLTDPLPTNAVQGMQIMIICAVN
jgi:hypothetical protein